MNNEKPPVPEPPKIKKIKEPSFDLLGGFDNNFSDPFPDLVGSALNKPTEPATLINSSSNSNLDDIFGSLPNSAAAPTMAPSKSSNDLNGFNFDFGIPQQSTTKPQEEVKKDPFADLMGAQFNATSFNKPPQNPFAQSSSSNNPSPRNNPSTPIHQMKSPNEPQKPDYSRSHFQDTSQQQQQQQQTGPQKSKSSDIFGDILGQQGYSFGKTNQGPKSINDMRKVELAQTMDPEKLKVSEWVRFII